MPKKSRFDSAFKVKVAIGAIRENKTLAELAVEYGVSPNKITQWKEELLANVSQAFEDGGASAAEMKKVKAERDRLYKKVGQLTLECDFFAGACEVKKHTVNVSIA